jgi:hypothetical protein
MSRVYLAFGMAVLGLYLTASVRGWELFASRRGFIPQDVRSQPGGYRSYGFWRGGK